MKFLRKPYVENLFRKTTVREKFICIDRNGIVEENFEKRRILHRKGGENSINWNIKMWEIYYETCNDIIQNVSKVHFLFLILMVPTQVSKIPTLF